MADEKDGKQELPEFDERKVDWAKCPNLYNVSEVRARRLWGQKEQREEQLRAALSALEEAQRTRDQAMARIAEAARDRQKAESENRRLLLNQKLAVGVLRRGFPEAEDDFVTDAISLLERKNV